MSIIGNFLRRTGGIRQVAKGASRSAVLVVFTAIVSVGLTYVMTSKSNSEMADRQREEDQIGQFQSTAALLDTSIGTFSDALVDQSEVNEARKAMRAAIARHSADVNAMQRLLGEGDAMQYLAGLANLRRLVEETTEPTNAMPMAQQVIDLLEIRQSLIKKVEGRLTYASRST